MRHSPPAFSTSQTLLWFAVLVGAWQLLPVDARWKVLPKLEQTFLVQGLRLNTHPDALAGAPGMAPPMPAEKTDNEEGDSFYDDIQVPSSGALPPNAAATATAGTRVRPATDSSPEDAAPVSEPGLTASSSALPGNGVAGNGLPGNGLPGPDAINQPGLTSTSGASVASLSHDAPVPAPSPSRDQDLLPPPRRPGSLVTPLEEAQPIEQGCLQGTPEACGRLALAPFFDALQATLNKAPGAITRISHFGDSVIASDYVSATVRRRLQRQFGDAGHGFVLAARPWRWYDHRGIVHNASSQWKPHGVVFHRFNDRLYGFGGVAFQTAEAGATVDLATATDGRMGRAVGKIELYYYAQPGGGTLQVTLNGLPQAPLQTASEVAQSAYHSLLVPDGPARLKLTTEGNGPVRLYGATFERTVPGVVYDSLGIVGGSVPALRKIDRQQWNEQLAHRAPDLVILNFGANESLTYNDATPRMMKDYARQLGNFIRSVQQARPQASVLVMGPMDAGQLEGDQIVSRPSIVKIRAAQRQAALENGAAFWDTYAVMGGEGSMARWVASRLGSSDMVHPSWQAAVFLGNELARSIITTFESRGEALTPALLSGAPAGGLADPASHRTDGLAPAPGSRAGEALTAASSAPPATATSAAPAAAHPSALPGRALPERALPDKAASRPQEPRGGTL